MEEYSEAGNLSPKYNDGEGNEDEGNESGLVIEADTQRIIHEVIGTDQETGKLDEPAKESEQLRQKTDEISPVLEENVTNSEQATTTAKTNRELKLLLELSKEANLNTNISYKRKSVDPNRLSDQGSSKSDQEITMSETRDTGKRSMRSQNPEFVAKQQKFLSRVTGLEAEIVFAGSEIEDKAKERSAKRSSLTENVIENITEDSFKKIRKPIKNGKDPFCWRCHRDGVQISCETCVRSFHFRCLKSNVSNTSRWPCPVCVAILRAENIKTRSTAMKNMSLEQISGLLKFAHKRMVKCSDAEPFMHPVNEEEFPEYKRYIIHPMDLRKLEKYIKQNLFGSTTAFEAEAKWMLHNSIIFNSYQAKVTSIAKSIIKICRQEMQEIENCPSCYLNANTKTDWFIEVCPKPHLLVWAKLKGFPYWPAKAMTTNTTGMVDVRFFGAHDRAWVPIKECFLFSRKDPNSNKQKRNDIIESLKELEMHIEKLKEAYGDFQYPEYRTPLDPKMELEQIQLFLPKYQSQENKHSDKENCSQESSDSERNLATPSPNSKSISGYSRTSKAEGEGYGTDEESNILSGYNVTFSDNEDEYDTQNDSYSTDNSSTKPKTRNIQNDTRKRLLDERDCELVLKRSRRGSDMSSKSDSSRVSNISDKTSKVNLLETVVLSPSSSEAKHENLVENNTSTSELLENEDKMKPEEVNTDNKEFTISPVKTSIADHLMRKLTENDNQKVVQNIRKQLFDKMNISTEKSNGSNDNKDAVSVCSMDFEQDTEGAASESIKQDDSSVLCDAPEVPISTTNEENESIVNSPDSTNQTTAKNKRKLSDIQETTESKVIKVVDINAITEKNISSTAKILDKPEITLMVKSPKEHLKSVSSSNKSSPSASSKAFETSDESVRYSQLSQSTNQSITSEIDLCSAEIKSEIISDNEEEDYALKRQFFSSLNIGEKSLLPIKVKSREIQTRLKSFEKSKHQTDRENTTEENGTDLRAVDNLTKVIDTVASTYSKEHEGEEITLKKSEPVKKDAKILSYSRIKPKNHSLLKKVIVNGQEVKSVQVPTKAVSIPKVSLATTRNLMVIAPTSLAHRESQNYIPQQSSSVSLLRTPVGSKNSTNAVPNQIILNGSCGVLANATASSSQPQNTPANKETTENTVTNLTESLDQLAKLSEIIPENISRAVTEILCRPLPKLKPRPQGPLSNHFEEGLPSCAGPITDRVNSISHRMNDYFRGMLIELLQEMGSDETPEVTITNLKLELEQCKHRHNEELLEMKKNINSILKDIQKAFSEEKQRFLDETRANCEAETIRRVQEAKTKQWCANCYKEAYFFCCWNTSYCDYSCQKTHWPKHSTECQNNSNVHQNSTKSSSQPVLIRPTSAQKGITTKSILAKPAKLIYRNSNGPMNYVKGTTGNHITIVESTPGKFELVGNGPIAVGGKIVANSSKIISKILPGNILTVSSPSSITSSTQQTFVITQAKSVTLPKPATITTAPDDDDVEIVSD